VEVLAAVLLELYPHLQLTFEPRSAFSRNYRKDILHEEVVPGEEDVPEAITWQLSRDGLYDLLPEGLFHQPQNRKAFRRTDEMIDEYKRQKREEKEARTFFLPFEQAFYGQRLLLEQQEQQALTGFTGRQQQQLLQQFWGVKVPLSPSQLSALMHVLPLAQRIIGEWELVEQCFEAILGVPVHLKRSWRGEQVESQLDTPALGAANLGVDFVLGHTFNTQIPVFIIEAGPLPGERIPAWLPGAAERNILDLLCDFFIPIEAEVQISLLIGSQGETATFTLDETADGAGRLGYTTTLT